MIVEGRELARGSWRYCPPIPPRDWAWRLTRAHRFDFPAPEPPVGEMGSHEALADT